MASLKIIDECLTPEKYVYIKYSGPDPWGIAKKIAADMKPFFHISTSRTSRKRLNWDVAADPITFYAKWWVRREATPFSEIYIEMAVFGNKSKVTNKGEFTLRMEGQLITERKGWGIFLRPFWLLYSYLYYDRIRRQHIEACRSAILNFRNEIKEHFGVGKTAVPQGGSFG